MKRNSSPDFGLIADNFAGGGGASVGIEMALRRSVDIAVNHDRDAIGMHAINHPNTEHYCEDVWNVDPLQATKGRPVALAWFSPDCKHHSKARGQKPVNKNIRGLAWVALRWVDSVRPKIIILENVEEFQQWGPVVHAFDDTGRLKYNPDGSKVMVPCTQRKGETFAAFVKGFRKYGYEVEWRELRACDYGAPTIRKRLFLIARCDGLPVVWPKPTHAKKPAKGSGLKPYKTAADCIDWSIPCPSIFDRKKPLAENTMRRIAAGLKRFVFENAQPFIVTVNHGSTGEDFRGQELGQPLNTATQKNGFALVTPYLTEHANASGQRNFAAEEPLRTQCAEVKGGHFAIVTPFLQRQFGTSIGSDMEAPVGTLTTKNKTSLCVAWLTKHFGGVTGVKVDAPMPTVMTRGTQTQITVAHIMKMRGENLGHKMDEPLHTVSAGGTHHAEVRAFLLKYYGNEKEGQAIDEPIGTVTTRDRFGLVTIYGEEYQIVDIGMRMLTARELARAQGFPDDYIIDRAVFTEGGAQVEKQLTKTAQVRMIGNSVCPPLAQALVEANVPDLALSSHYLGARNNG